jgi:pimeloyl-ACP methyl ester carboxylesterase
VVLVHQLGSTRAEWAPLVAALTRAPALSVLSIDLRGHGESTRRGGEALDFNTFGDDEWAKLTIDVTGAVALARERFGATRVMIAGASIGSSAAILAAASDPAVVGVVAISPGRAYHGIDSLTPMTALAGRPLLAIASTGEAHSAETARAMAAAAGGEVELYPGDAHGMRIANDSPEMIARADAFIRHALGRE